MHKIEAVIQPSKLDAVKDFGGAWTLTAEGPHGVLPRA